MVKRLLRITWLAVALWILLTLWLFLGWRDTTFRYQALSQEFADYKTAIQTRIQPHGLHQGTVHKQRLQR